VFWQFCLPQLPIEVFIGKTARLGLLIRVKTH
jgi:hypothetical protein